MMTLIQESNSGSIGAGPYLKPEISLLCQFGLPGIDHNQLDVLTVSLSLPDVFPSPAPRLYDVPSAEDDASGDAEVVP